MSWWGKNKKTPSRSRSSESKSGWVYLGESVRKSGKKMNYVGSTTRTVDIREREHKKEVGKTRSSTWVGKGKSYKTTQKKWSKNPRGDEKKVKSMSSAQKQDWFNSGKKTKYSSKKSPSKSRSNYYRSKRR
ncbi:hypothetical protein OAM96_04535 [Candidatus Poseidoniaceae archaeon]|nr:hypothetical protein [Candidatus Poseidoniaceae archaeon]